MIFPKPQEYSIGVGKFIIPTRLTISCNDEEFIAAFNYLKLALSSVYGINCELVNTDADIEITKSNISAEHYALIIANNGILIETSDLRGAIYAVGSLVQLIRDDEGYCIDCARILDGPASDIRGVHFYMPERSKIDEFKRIIDTMALLKMNTVILEVGGAMEYERHPEINEAWVKFCQNVGKFPGHNGYKNFQAADFYWKDSVHTEQSGGAYLTKSEVRDLVLYCKSRGMDVIPEVQGLSHSYYLTVAHPEIAELADDPFPDTYCPNNENSYRLYFDVAEEVIEVFEPTTVSIGHDEIRVLGWCDKCKGKSGHELVGKEILRLYEFYKEKGIRITMWGESAQTFTSYKGSEVGKKGIERRDRYGRYYQLPATYQSLDMLPNDILMIDWQHSSGYDSEECYNNKGFEVIYGNFYGSLIAEWEKRTEKTCFKGAEVSSWCPPTEEIFARDGIFFEMAFSSGILWDDSYSNNKYLDVCQNVSEFIPLMRSINSGKNPLLSKKREIQTVYLAEGEKVCQTLDLENAKIYNKDYKKLLPTLGKNISGISVDSGEILIKKDFTADSLIFLHNSKKEMPFYPSHYFMDEANWGLGAYAVCYEDGTVEVIGVYYGRQIGVKNFDYSRHRGTSTKSFEIDEELEEGDTSTLPCYFTKDFSWAESLCYNTTPIITDNGTVFAYEWTNPHPDKKITKIRPYSIPKVFNEYDMEQSIVLFGVLAVK